MNNLEVLNGEMALKYDKNIDTYSIKVSSDVNALEIKYELDDTSTLNVYGNTLLSPGENKVILACKNNDDIRYITLVVNKEKALKTTSLNVDYSNEKKVLPSFTIPLIASICFVLILITYYLLFKKKKM